MLCVVLYSCLYVHRIRSAFVFVLKCNGVCELPVCSSLSYNTLQQHRAKQRKCFAWCRALIGALSVSGPLPLGNYLPKRPRCSGFNNNYLKSHQLACSYTRNWGRGRGEREKGKQRIRTARLLFLSLCSFNITNEPRMDLFKPQKSLICNISAHLINGWALRSNVSVLIEGAF